MPWRGYSAATSCSIRKRRVLTLVFIIFFVTLIEIPAAILLGIWAVLQFLPALGQVGAPDVSGDSVAYFAHVGGFIFGLAMIKVFASRARDALPRAGFG